MKMDERADPVVLRGRPVVEPASFRRFRGKSDQAWGLRSAVRFAFSGLVHLLALLLLVEVIRIAAVPVQERVLHVSLRGAERRPPPGPVPVPQAPATAVGPPLAAPVADVVVSPAPLIGTAPPAAAAAATAVEVGASDSVHALDAPVEPGPYGLRSPEGRREALLRQGGNLASEGAVELGLRWLAAHQGADGGWSASGAGNACPSPDLCYVHRGPKESDLGVTSLALLAFLGAGCGAPDAPQSETVRRGLQRLAVVQDASGYFFNPATIGAGNKGEMYGHGMALFALAEAAAMSGVRDLLPVLERAVRATASAQQSDGGWTYQPDPKGRRGELTLTVWVLQGLEAAARAGVAGAAGPLARGKAYLLRSQVPGGGFAYTSASAPTSGSTAAGLFAACRLGLGDAVSLDRGLARLAMEEKSDPDPAALGTVQPIYAWYYRSLAAFQAQGRPWRDWNRKIRPYLVSQQRTSGHAAGSWALIDYASGSTVYSTALCVLTLETYYRYPPATAGALVRGLSAAPGVDESAPLTREEERRIEQIRPPSAELVEARRRRDLEEARRDLGSGRPERRYFAARRLAEAGDAGSVQALIAAVRLETGRLRAAQILHLGALKSDQAVAFLEGELDDIDIDVRSAAVAALSRITGEVLADEASARRLIRSRGPR